MNAHELARKLLEGPDLPVVVSDFAEGDPCEVSDVMVRESVFFYDRDDKGRVAPAIDLS